MQRSFKSRPTTLPMKVRSRPQSSQVAPFEVSVASSTDYTLLMFYIPDRVDFTPFSYCDQTSFVENFRRLYIQKLVCSLCTIRRFTTAQASFFCTSKTTYFGSRYLPFSVLIRRPALEKRLSVTRNVVSFTPQPFS